MINTRQQPSRFFLKRFLLTTASPAGKKTWGRGEKKKTGQPRVTGHTVVRRNRVLWWQIWTSTAQSYHRRDSGDLRWQFGRVAPEPLFSSVVRQPPNARQAVEGLRGRDLQSVSWWVSLFLCAALKCLGLRAGRQRVSGKLYKLLVELIGVCSLSSSECAC